MSGFSFSPDTWLGIGTVVAGYVLNPICLSPDMDLPESSPSNAWGPLEFLFWPYQMLIHKGGGRNAYSHWPPLSTLLRVGYLWLMLFIVGAVAMGMVNLIVFGLSGQIMIPVEWLELAFWYWLMCWKFPAMWRFIWGVALGDFLHIASDILYSFMRK